MTNILTPNAKQQFFDNSGKPAIGYKLFTYSAGTTTKIATKVSPAGADNANPIIMDYRGEANIWIPPNVAFKYVLAPPTDTDPPTNPVWTIDNIINNQIVTLFGGVDTGITNAYVLNFAASFSVYADGIVIYWVPSNTNTSASTINVNGLGFRSIVNQDGSALYAGQLRVNQIAIIVLNGGVFQLLNNLYSSGSFTGTLNGMTAVTTGTVNYSISGNIATLSNRTGLAITGTSNTTSMAMSGLPALLTPTTSYLEIPTAGLIDNSNILLGTVQISAGVLTFALSNTSGVANRVQANSLFFTAAGAKGLNIGWYISYPLS